MNIVITGSLGNISKPLATELIAKGHSVTVISSNSDRQKEIEVLGAKAAIGSLDNAAFLTTTFKNADAVYCMIPPNFAAHDQIEYYVNLATNYAQGISQSSIKRVVHLSSWGAHRESGTGIIVGSHNVELILNELSNVSVTHLRAGSFFYNLFNFIDMIKDVGFIGTNYGGNDTIVWSYPTDIAAAAAEELQKKSGDGSSVRYVASDERTANETASILGAAIGKPELEWKLFSDEQVTNAMIQRGMNEKMVANLVDLGASIHNGAMGEDYFLHKPMLGKVKAEDFATEFATAYNK